MGAIGRTKDTIQTGYNKVSETSLWGALSAPLRAISGPLLFFLKLIFLILGLMILILFLIFIYNGFTKGEIVDRVDAQLEQWGIKFTLAEYFVKGYEIVSWDIASKPQSNVLGWEGETQTETSDVDMKVRLIPKKDIVYSNEDILASASITIGTVPENKQITLNFEDACYLEDYYSEDNEFKSIPPIGPTTKVVTAGMENQIFRARCEFVNGIPNERVDQEESYDIKKMRFLTSISYDTQQVSWYPWIKSMPTGDEEVKKPTWNVKEGPADLRLGSSESQPFYSNERGYILYVNLKRNWQGDIKEIKNLYVDAGESVILETESKYCDFIDSGYGYVLKPEVLEEANIDCTDKEKLKEFSPLYGSSNMNYNDCIEKIKSEFTFECPFIIITGQNIESRTRITASVDYIFELISSNSVKVIKQDEELVEETESTSLLS